jgi:hypothetical protein
MKTLRSRGVAKRESFSSTFKQHKGKVSIKYDSYLKLYDQVFQKYYDGQVNLLEIGVQNGGSFEIYSELFANNSQFVGCDIDMNCQKLDYDNESISIVIGDATEAQTKIKILNACKRYDVVIDDGSHQQNDIINAFLMYFPVLSEDGVYIVEDLHTSYWQTYGGGLFKPDSAINFFKLLADVINHEHWGVSLIRDELLTMADKDLVQQFHSHLSQISSIEFANSICVIKKSTNNNLGRKVVSGQDSIAEQGNNHDFSICQDQSDNPWSDTSNLFESAHKNQVNLYKKEVELHLQTILTLQSQLTEQVEYSNDLYSNIEKQVEYSQDLYKKIEEQVEIIKNLKNKLKGKG